jgi:hypothetical protein
MAIEENVIMKATRTLIAVGALVVAMLACNLPSSQKPAQQPGPAATDTPALVVLESSNTPAFTETPSLTPTITLTPTPSVPEVNVTSATNCRTGPGTEYDLLYTLQPGQVAQIIGKDTPDHYWIITFPGGTTCWLWGQYAVVSGNIAALPESPVPPTPTPSIPANPSGLKVHRTCTLIPMQLKYRIDVELSWQDNATNELGYYVYRNGDLLATLGANETGFSDTTYQGTAVGPGVVPGIEYAVQAFNDAGKSKRIDKTISCIG